MPLHCSHWGTYRVRSINGRIAEMLPFELDRDPSPIGNSQVDTLNHPLRITAPMVRKSWLESGPGSATRSRGSDQFVELSWDDAESLVANELDRVRRCFGNASIYAGSYGWASAGRFHHAQSQLKRFMNCIGGFTYSVNSYSLAAAEVVMPHIMGPFHKLLDEMTSWSIIADHTELFVAFGGVPLKNGQINAGGAMNHCQRDGLNAAHRSGVRFVNISPVRDDLHDGLEAEWLQPRPGSDTAVMLGLAHTIFLENLHDQTFLDKYCSGFGRFLEYLTGKTDGVPKSADWAASISGLSADSIRRLARRMASSRTMISVSWSLTRQDHGEQPFWSAVTVAAMLGQIGLPGGGIGFGYGAVNSIGDQFTIVPAASLPQGRNSVTDFIPVARISDMLLNPGAQFDYDGRSFAYPDIRLVYWAGGNPFHHHQDLFRLKEAWSRPETVISHEWVWNALSRHSDIVLPCTTALERNDLAISRSPYLVFSEKAVEPPSGCRNDFEIFGGLARRLGVGSEFTEDRGEADWLEWLYEKTRRRMQARSIELPPFEVFRRQGYHQIGAPQNPKNFLQDFRENRASNPLPTPSGKIEIYSETVAGFGYSDCPGHAVWLEPVEWLGSKDRRFPLHLISNQPETKLHSQLDHGSVSMADKIGGREPIAIHPSDARERGINEGDVVRIFNDRASCLAVARVTDSVMEQVLRMSTGAWFDPSESANLGPCCMHGNPNALTLDKGTSRLAQGPIAHTCLVEIEAFDGVPPDIGVRTPPEIIPRSARSTNH